MNINKCGAIVTAIGLAGMQIVNSWSQTAKVILLPLPFTYLLEYFRSVCGSNCLSFSGLD